MDSRRIIIGEQIFFNLMNADLLTDKGQSVCADKSPWKRAPPPAHTVLGDKCGLEQ